MRNSKILAKHRAGQRANLCMLGHFIPPFIAFAAHFGYDGIWLDLEHRAFDPREVQALLAFCHLYDIDCLLRPATRDKAQLYRYYEDGATGLVIPHVNTAEEARELVQKVKFPPIGDRGSNPTGLEADFGTTGTRDSVVEHALRETFLLVQIETPMGLSNVDAIASINGIDGFFGGGGDYAIRLRHLPPDEQVPYLQAMQKVASLSAQHHKLWGTMSADVQELQQWVDMGANLLMWGVDIEILRDALQHGQAILQQVRKD
jgi:4-hydroxy-2-oxoheptanedioate aldolase